VTRAPRVSLFIQHREFGFKNRTVRPHPAPAPTQTGRVAVRNDAFHQTSVRIRSQCSPRALAMVDIEVVELLDSSEDEAPPMRAEPDIQEVTVDRQIRAPEAAAGGDDDDDVIVTGPYPRKLAPRPFLESAPTTRRLPYRATPRALTGVLDVAQPSVERAALRSPRCQRKRARGSFLQIRDLTRVPSTPPPRVCSSLPRLTGMVGDDALVDYPHPRHACAVFKFETTNHRTHCPNCWYDANDAPRAFPLLPRSSLPAFRDAQSGIASSSRRK